MPFLSSEQIVIDTHKWMAIDKHSSFDLLNPPLKYSNPWANHKSHLHLPWRRFRFQNINSWKFWGASTCLLPGPIMAAVWDHIKGLAFQELLKEKDAKMKLKVTDCFPLHLPDSTDDIPGHMFHHIWLKDPTKVNNGKGYAAPNKY
jgi:hypothetical protein